MADSGPFKIVGWMSDDFSYWLIREVPAMSRARPVYPQLRTFRQRYPPLAAFRLHLPKGPDARV